MEWIGLVILIFFGLLFFAPDVLLVPASWGFAGMMEPTKSPRLLHCGIALALLGPALILAMFFLGGLLNWLGLTWPSVICVFAAVVLVPTWVIAGIVLGFLKARHDEAKPPIVDQSERTSEQRWN